MKNIIHIIGILVVVFLCSRCYEDKGNYDYKDTNVPTVLNIGYNQQFNLTVGDEILIQPDIVYEKGNIPDVEYEWVISDEVVSKEKDLWISEYKGRSGYLKASLNIIDKATGIKFLNPFRLVIASKYEAGFLVLSEKEGKSQLSFIREKSKYIDGEWVEVYEDETDINPDGYGVKPVRLVEHWTADDEIIGEILVINEDECLELEGADLNVELNTRDEFMDGVYPANFKPVDALYLLWNSYLIMEDGTMYGRRVVDIYGYHTGKYLDLPIVTSGGMNAKKVLRSNYLRSNHGLIYSEDQSNRLLLIADNTQESSEYVGNISPLEYWWYPNEDCTPLDNMGDKKLKFAGYFTYGYKQSGYFTILQSESTGKYYMQEFVAGVSYGEADVKDFVYEAEFPGGFLLKDDSQILVCPEGTRVFFSSDNKLYHVDRWDENYMEVREYSNVQFDAKITSLCQHRNKEQIGVGLENGEFCILASDDRSLVDGGKIEYQAKTNFGKIVSSIYKYGKKKYYENPNM